MKISEVNITRKNIRLALTRHVRISTLDASAVLESVLDGIASGLKHEVKVSSFGVFEVRNKEEMAARKPLTGEVAIVPSQKAISFYASPFLKACVEGKSRFTISSFLGPKKSLP